MEKIDSKRVMTPKAAHHHICPFLTKPGSDVDSAVYCMAGACMAWHWRNEETQYRVRMLENAPNGYIPLTYWMSKDEAVYYEKTGYYEVERPREPAGWCGYNK